MPSKTIENLVATAQSTEITRQKRQDAFGELITRFQDMAYSCAYGILSDFHLAQDAAQEAFISAYKGLPRLQAAGAFPGRRWVP